MDGHGPLARSFLRESGQVGIRYRERRGTLEVGRPLRRSLEALGAVEGYSSLSQDSPVQQFPL